MIINDRRVPPPSARLHRVKTTSRKTFWTIYSTRPPRRRPRQRIRTEISARWKRTAHLPLLLSPLSSLHRMINRLQPCFPPTFHINETLLRHSIRRLNFMISIHKWKIRSSTNFSRRPRRRHRRVSCRLIIPNRYLFIHIWMFPFTLPIRMMDIRFPRPRTTIHIRIIRLILIEYRSLCIVQFFFSLFSDWTVILG